MTRLLRRFLTLPTAQPMAAGVVAEKSALLGLLALMANTNAYTQNSVGVTTAGTDSTLTAAQSIAGVVLLAAGASGGFTITLPTTKALITAFGNTIPLDGTFEKRISFVNIGVGQTGTLTAGDASTTVSGTATIATNTTRTFILKVASATTITITNLGSMSL